MYYKANITYCNSVMKRSVRLNIHQPSPFNWYNIIYRQILWKIMIIHCDVVIINCDVIPNNTQNIDCWCLYHVIHFIRPYQPVSRKKVVAHHMYDILWSSPESEVFTVLKNIQPPVIIYCFVGSASTIPCCQPHWIKASNLHYLLVFVFFNWRCKTYDPCKHDESL